MRTEVKTRVLYEYAELSEDAKKRALERARKEASTDYDQGWISREVCDSLISLYREAGIRVRDYSIGAYSYSSIKLDLDDDVRNLKGGRAMAWLENNLLGKFRIPYVGKRRAEVRRYGKGYRAGEVEPCPFTGICYDESFLEALRDFLRDPRNTLGDALLSLADTAKDILEKEYEHRTSDECLLEELTNGDCEFTAEGDLA